MENMSVNRQRARTCQSILLVLVLAVAAVSHWTMCSVASHHWAAAANSAPFNQSAVAVCGLRR